MLRTQAQSTTPHTAHCQSRMVAATDQCTGGECLHKAMPDLPCTKWGSSPRLLSVERDTLHHHAWHASRTMRWSRWLCVRHAERTLCRPPCNARTAPCRCASPLNHMVTLSTITLPSPLSVTPSLHPRTQLPRVVRVTLLAPQSQPPPPTAPCPPSSILALGSSSSSPPPLPPLPRRILTSPSLCHPLCPQGAQRNPSSCWLVRLTPPLPQASPATLHPRRPVPPPAPPAPSCTPPPPLRCPPAR